MTDLPLKTSAPITWAQRRNLVYLMVEVEDLEVDEVSCQSGHFVFKGHSKEARYSVELDLFSDLNCAEYKKAGTARHTELVIPKEKEEWWPRLLRSTTKVPWIKVDFDKYVDEEECDPNEDDFDLTKYMNSTGFKMPTMGKGGPRNNDEPVSDESDEDESGDEETLDGGKTSAPGADLHGVKPGTSTQS